MNWLASTIGKRNYIAHYLRESSPAGSRVIGTGNEKHTPGFSACDKAWLVPGILDDEYLPSVIEVCRTEKINAAITLSDLDLRVLPRIRHDLTSLGIHCFFPDEEVATRFGDKSKAFQFFKDNGFDTPASSTDLEAAIREIGFPMVIKPYDGSASLGYAVVHDESTARAHWNAINNPFAQEFIAGRLVNVEACSDETGEVLGVSVWERHSSIAGETLLAETIDHASARDLVLNLLAVSPIPGPIDVDIIEKDGRLFFIEINTRFGGGYPASHLAGADFTGALVQSIDGLKPNKIDQYKRGVVMMKEIRPFVFDPSRISKIEGHPENQNKNR